MTFFLNLLKMKKNDDVLQIVKEIDRSIELGDEQSLRTSTAKSEPLLNVQTDKKIILAFSYKLENAYSFLYTQFEYKNGVKIIPVNQSLQNAKRCIRLALSVSSTEKSNLVKQLWVNYGNVLDYLGRGVEALYAYEQALKLDPKFAMAVGNKAITSRRFAIVTGEYFGVMQVEAYQAIGSIIDDPELVAVGGMEAKNYLKMELDRIESMVKDKKVLKQKMPHEKYDSSNLDPFEKFYLEFCIKNDLFLNFHIHDKSCESAISDPIFISTITEIKDNDTFYNLARYINQIKEDYAVARLSLVQSQYRQKVFDRISKRTTYIYPLDYSQSHIYYGLLKSAFKDAFSILDKIAVFLNMYLSLGLDETKISFDSDQNSKNSIWLETKLKGQPPEVRERFLDTENTSLYALYDIYKDFRNGHYKDIKEIRNALTHRQLTIFMSGIIQIPKNTNFFSIESDDMLEKTLEVMRLTKAAIIYLINAVTIEESKKRKDSGKIIPEFPVDTTQFL